MDVWFCIEQEQSPRGKNRERSEEHTSELQSQSNLVCRLLLEKKKTCHNRARRMASYRARLARVRDESLIPYFSYTFRGCGTAIRLASFRHSRSTYRHDCRRFD